jgi:hypothetical protein
VIIKSIRKPALVAHAELAKGFDPDRSGDDGFDAVVGLLGMLDVVLGNLESGEPEDDTTQIEGWILGYLAS